MMGVGGVGDGVLTAAAILAEPLSSACSLRQANSMRCDTKMCSNTGAVGALVGAPVLLSLAVGVSCSE